jgi:bifunctional NMN adenylyltransferase/nudix hydrolase
MENVMKKFEYCIFIGNFQPFHLGHKQILDEALNISETVIVILGSHNASRNIINSWSTEERIKMISDVYPEVLDRIKFICLRDQLYNETLWGLDLQQKVAEIIGDSDKVALIGNERDSKYLNAFPQWTLVGVKVSAHNASDIRYRYFTYDTSFARFVPENVGHFLKEFEKTDNFKNLKEEFDFVKKYQSAWSASPFPPTFVTVDCVVLKSNHILLVRRKGNPGKGLLALPGGFLNQHELIEQAAIRELKEETAIKLPKDELAKYIVTSKVYDAPFRSIRGRTITHAFLINLGIGALDKVKGSDDADKAFWLPLNEVDDRECEFFEDHFYIIKNLVNKI